MEIKQIKDNIWKFSGDSNIYFLDFDEKILIDCGNRIDEESYKKEINKIISLNKIEKIFFTHLHYDHVGCYRLFPNAKFYASKSELECLDENALGTVLYPGIETEMEELKIKEIKDCCGLKVIECPGHTRGSIAFWYEKEKILFSGDTLFFNDMIGRCDLPTSIREKMDSSLEKLKKLDYDILCPGHDY